MRGLLEVPTTVGQGEEAASEQAALLGLEGWGERGREGKDFRVVPPAEGMSHGSNLSGIFRDSCPSIWPPGTPGGLAGARRSVWTPASQSLGTSAPVTSPLPFPSNPFFPLPNSGGTSTGRVGSRTRRAKEPSSCSCHQGLSQGGR